MIKATESWGCSRGCESVTVWEYESIRVWSPPRCAGWRAAAWCSAPAGRRQEVMHRRWCTGGDAPGGDALHYGLSNVIIRDQKFAKVCKSKTLLLAHIWTKRTQFFFKRSKTGKILQQIFYQIFFHWKNVKFLALNGKKPERLVP